MNQVLLCTEGTYPYGLGGVSTWCDQLIRGLAPSGYRFTIWALHAAPAAPAFRLPDNVSALEVIRAGQPPDWPALARASPAHLLTAFDWALAQLMRGCGRCAHDFAAGLTNLAFVAQRLSLWPLFARRAAQRVLAQGLRRLTGGPVTRQEVLLGARWLRDLLVPVLRCPTQKLDLAVATAAGPGALPAWLASRQLGVPYVLVEHGVALREALLALHAAPRPPGFRHLQAAFHEALARLLIQDAVRVIAVCRFNTVWETRLGGAANRIQVIHNGIEPALYPDLTLHANPTPTAGWIGRIDPLKGLEGLIAAFALVIRSLPHARLRLYGPVPAGNEAYHRDVQESICEAGLKEQVTFEGLPDSVPEALRACDVVALPSISEGLPYVLLEAMMCGRSVVAHRVGGIPEALGNAGKLVELHDTPAFAQALADLLGSAQARAALGRQARQRALEHFTAQAMLNQYRLTFAEVLSGARA